MLWRYCICGALLLAALNWALGEDVKTTYALGPKDEFTVTVLKHQELSGSYTVPPDGVLAFPRVEHAINVLQMTTADLSQALTDAYGAFLREPQVTVVLSRARDKTASVLGAVGKPGEYPITDATKLTDLLATAGGLIGETNELSAQLTRKGKASAVELQAALRGEPTADLVLQEGDQIQVIAPVRISVTVSGQVKNPGTFKLRPTGTPVDALAAAGDITGRPDRVRIMLVHGTDVSPLKWGDSTVILQDGDVIRVENEPQARIYVQGSVRSTGAYDLPDGGGVMEAIALAGGPLPSAALGQVTIVRAKTGVNERVDLREAFSKGLVGANPKLNPEDQVIVPAWNARISVFGKVAKPGNFDFSENTPVTVIDALTLAGGADKRAKLAEVTVIRVVDGKPQRIPVNVNDILAKGKQETNIQLQGGDIVFVPDNGKTDWGSLLDSLYKVGILATVL